MRLVRLVVASVLVPIVMSGCAQMGVEEDSLSWCVVGGAVAGAAAGVATDGEVALCHRFAGSEEHTIGTVQDGVDREKQEKFLVDHHIAEKTDCHKCWARPICSGGCYHEAHVQYGNSSHANLHYCTWVRSWTHTCLEIYGALAEKNPKFLERFDA